MQKRALLLLEQLPGELIWAALEDGAQRQLIGGETGDEHLVESRPFTGCIVASRRAGSVGAAGPH
jgi:hypothetical protein